MRTFVHASMSIIGTGCGISWFFVFFLKMAWKKASDEQMHANIKLMQGGSVFDADMYGSKASEKSF